ncbi:MAG: hypothetical protein JXR95_10415 [Deltaproteobacteria bacterium]|nr:hypothetical protein [Deltaproteobacteria bacterium]
MKNFRNFVSAIFIFVLSSCGKNSVEAFEGAPVSGNIFISIPEKQLFTDNQNRFDLKNLDVHRKILKKIKKMNERLRADIKEICENESDKSPALLTDEYQKISEKLKDDITRMDPANKCGICPVYHKILKTLSYVIPALIPEICQKKPGVRLHENRVNKLLQKATSYLKSLR